MIIDLVRLPIDVERGTKAGPLFNTSVLSTDGGVTSTNQNWSYPLIQGQVGYGLQSKANLDSVIAFFWARRGRFRGFLFRDWSDYTFTAQNIGTGNGSTQNFQIVKTYADTVLPFSRIIKRPIEADLLVYLNGVLSAPANWTLLSGGIVRFTVAPAAAVVVTVSGTFDIAMQFATDQLEVEMEVWSAGAIPSIPIREVRE